METATRLELSFCNNVQIRKDHKLATKQLESNWLQPDSNDIHSTNFLSPRTFNLAQQNLYLVRFRIRSKYLSEVLKLWRKIKSTRMQNSNYWVISRRLKTKWNKVLMKTNLGSVTTNISVSHNWGVRCPPDPTYQRTRNS